MPKVNNIASTAHAQHAELQSVLDATGNTTELRAALKDALAKYEACQLQITELEAQLTAEKEAHEKTQAALDAATETPPQQ